MRKTKIVATISDLRCDDAFLQQMIDAGADAFRLNSAHMPLETAKDLIERTRALAPHIPCIIDTKGPEIRTRAPGGAIALKDGERILVSYGEGESTAEHLFVSHERFVEEIGGCTQILIDDGAIELLVEEKGPRGIRCRIVAGGSLEERKSVNVPGAAFSLRAISDKDERFLRLAAQADCDFVAHSFVRSKEDIAAVREHLAGSRVKVIAKIENAEGVESLKEILAAADGVMVARGDLALEIPAAEVPLVQKRIIAAAREAAKPVITATQMLHSMMQSPRPTRAEVSDVANAVLDGTDAVMLSGETTKGKYPVESVSFMAKILATAERDVELPFPQHRAEAIAETLTRAVARAAQELSPKAIIVPTNSGFLPRKVASYRTRPPIYAECYHDRVMRELGISCGVFAIRMDVPSTRDDLVRRSLLGLLEARKVAADDLVILLAGTPGKEGSALIEVNTARRALEMRG